MPRLLGGALALALGATLAFALAGSFALGALWFASLARKIFSSMYPT